MTPETTAVTPAAEEQAELLEFRLARQADVRKAFIGRCLIHAFPLIAASVSAAYAAILYNGGPAAPPTSLFAVWIINAAMAAIVSAAGVMFLTGRVWVRIAGAFAYAVLGLFLYGITLGCLIALYASLMR